MSTRDITRSSPARVGRPKGATADATRERILDAAEMLFAERGYDGTSIRDIAEIAGIRVAVVGYHFGLKDALFDVVIARRAGIMNGQRNDVLAAARRAAGRKPVALEELIRGYVVPFVDFARHGDRGWRNYAVLMGRLANSPRGTAVIERHYGATAKAYLDEFFRALPRADRLAVIESFLVMVSGMLFLCASTGRMETMQAGVGVPAGTPASILDNLIRFTAAGFRALEPA